MSIDRSLVGALVNGDFDGLAIDEADARLIAAHRVATPVDRVLHSNPSLATDVAAAIVHRAAKRAAVNSLALVFTSNRVAQVLADADIRALVYKGVAVAVQNQTSWRGRESVDVDVLVSPDDLDRVHEALTTAGLARRDGEAEPPSRLFRYHQIELAYSGLPVAVDLHWKLESPGFLDLNFNDLWARRQRINSDGLQVWVPSPSEAVLISAVHGCRENWRAWRHMLDAATGLVGLSEAQWEQTIDLAAASGASRSLAVALAVAAECGVKDLPAHPGPWAKNMANEYLSGGATGRGPSYAARRRIKRWQLAASPVNSLDALMRAVVRQVAYPQSRKFVFVRRS